MQYEQRQQVHCEYMMIQNLMCLFFSFLNDIASYDKQKLSERKRLEKQQQERAAYDALSYEQQQKRDAVMEKRQMRKRTNRMKVVKSCHVFFFLRYNM